MMIAVREAGRWRELGMKERHREGAKAVRRNC